MAVGVTVMVTAGQLSPPEPLRASVTRSAPHTTAPMPVASARPVVAPPQRRRDQPNSPPEARPARNTSEPPATMGPPATKPEEQAPSLSRETALLASAQRALGSGRAQLALQILEQYRAAFPEGALREEATGARILALCAVGRRIEGERERQAFLQIYPASPLAARVSAACLGGSP